jgi:hypothetical protein
MAIYFYAKTPTAGLGDLISRLNAQVLRKHDGMHFLRKGVPVEFSPHDSIVCWGAHIPPIKAVRVLNAKLEYPTQLELNVNGLRKLRKLGKMAFALQTLSLANWKKLLPVEDKDWYPVGAKYTFPTISLREFEGYGVSYYRFKSVSKSIVFCGKIIAGNDNNGYALESAKDLGLDFGELWYGFNAEGAYLLKVITAPHLDTAGVELFKRYIEAWVKNEE